MKTEDDLEIILALLGAWTSEGNPTAKLLQDTPIILTILIGSGIWLILVFTYSYILGLSFVDYLK